jgi:hypothetical protein
LTKQRADDRGDDRHAAQRQRVEHRRWRRAPESISAPSSMVAITVTA